MTTLRNLPVDTRPALAMGIAVEKLGEVAKKTEKVLSPSFFRKLLGGTSRDHARSIVALSLEDTLEIRSLILDVRKSAVRNGGQDALMGSAERVLKAIDSWREAALDFEEAVHGAQDILLGRTKRMSILCADLKSPASGIYTSA